MGLADAEHQFHVLAVDDSFLDRKLIERLLRSSSYQVTTVDSGSKALEFLGFQEDQQNKTNQASVFHSSHKEQEHEQVLFFPKKKDVEVNLIITDYCMPGMTGYDLLKKIKESSSLRNIPVVILSSENVPSRISRCLEEGAEEFFVKPMSLSDVNKLKPHVLKSKYGDQNQQEKIENDDYEELQKAAEEQQKLQPPPPLPEEKTEEAQQQQQNKNKRTTSLDHDEGILPARTRPRYSDLTVV